MYNVFKTALMKGAEFHILKNASFKSRHKVWVELKNCFGKNATIQTFFNNYRNKLDNLDLNEDTSALD